MKITRPLFVALASLVATGALAGGAWAAIGTDAPVSTRTNDGMQAGVEGTGAWIDEYEMTSAAETTEAPVNDGMQAGVEGTGAWIDEYEMVAADETPVNDGMQPGVEGTGDWIDEYELVPGVNDGMQPGVEGSGAWIDVYED